MKSMNPRVNNSEDIYTDEALLEVASMETPIGSIRKAETNRSSKADRPLGPRVGGLAQPRKLNDATFTGYEDVIVKSPLIELTIEDLNDILDGGVDYYAGDGNRVSSKPPNVDGFGMKVVSLGPISRAQEVTCKLTGNLHRRIWNGSTFTQWSTSYTTENKPSSDDIAGGVKLANIATDVDDKFIPKQKIDPLLVLREIGDDIFLPPADSEVGGGSVLG